MADLRVDPAVADQILACARRLTARGYVANQLGNVAVRVPHPAHEHGIIYTKHAGVSLEDATADNIVITDVPTGALLYGRLPTSIGHQLNREILRLRPDVGAVIHVHHDDTIALFASRVVKELRVLSLEFPLIMGRPRPPGPRSPTWRPTRWTSCIATRAIYSSPRAIGARSRCKNEASHLEEI